MNNKTAAIIGGGVIGGGWAARFLLNGWNVRVYDPSDDAQNNINAVLDNARASLPELADVPMPAEGALSFVADIKSAVTDADWIQESVPERIEIKHSVFKEIHMPTVLQENATHPGQIVVTHPFNPVYLLPLVEVVAGKASDPEIVDLACKLLTELGMKPLKVRKEIDAHIADRFLEAVWREGLWLIKDGVATTEEIDDAIRYGFGLRWGQMGLFETYRVAGGEAGMAHFIAQFGPCLKWPWTKLMDVPELTDELVERIRDNNLVAMMRGLKQTDWGAGRLLNEHDQRLKEENPNT